MMFELGKHPTSASSAGSGHTGTPTTEALLSSKKLDPEQLEAVSKILTDDLCSSMDELEKELGKKLRECR
ncbi:MAG: hypothetical protein ACMUIE_01950 [Thermoplasmatota archaeon]